MEEKKKKKQFWVKLGKSEESWDFLCEPLLVVDLLLVSWMQTAAARWLMSSSKWHLMNLFKSISKALNLNDDPEQWWHEWGREQHAGNAEHNTKP